MAVVEIVAGGGEESAGPSIAELEARRDAGPLALLKARRPVVVDDRVLRRQLARGQR